MRLSAPCREGLTHKATQALYVSVLLSYTGRVLEFPTLPLLVHTVRPKRSDPEIDQNCLCQGKPNLYSLWPLGSSRREAQSKTGTLEALLAYVTSNTQLLVTYASHALSMNHPRASLLFT